MASTQRSLSQTDSGFLARMEGDTDARRKTKYINELKKHPSFKPSMLEPPKPRFKVASLTDGPVIKTTPAGKTGLEPKKPYQWGPLGGWY